MQPRFNIARENTNGLFMKHYSNDSCILQFHSQIEIYFVDEGSMEMSVRGRSCTLGQGQFSVALSYEPHAYKTPSASRSSVLLIPPFLCGEFIAAIKEKRLSTPFVTDTAVYEQIRPLYTAMQEPDISHVRTIGYLYVILGIILEHVGLEAADTPDSLELATRILYYVHRNYKEDITPGTVAAHFGYSNSYISRYFSSCFGITLVKYLTELRLKNAVALMHTGKYDITACAFESGFSSMRTFYRVFQEEFGQSPTAYLKQAEAL